MQIHCNECGVLFPAEYVVPVEKARKGHNYDELHRWMYCLFCLRANNDDVEYDRYMKLREKRLKQRESLLKNPNQKLP